MNEKETREAWSSALAYEKFMGRWSRLVAREFILWLGVAPDMTWLDVGCGTGALTEAIFELASPHYIVGSDGSEAYIDFLRQRLTDERLCFDVESALGLNFDDEFYGNTVSGLTLNFVSTPPICVAEMARVTKPGGTVAAYVWDYADGMQMLRYFWNAATELDPAAHELDEGVRFAICKPETLAALFRDAGSENVETRAIDVPIVFQDFDDYWQPFLGAQGPAPHYVTSLSEEHRAALRDRIHATLPTSKGGFISLQARAWAVRGTRQ